MSNPGNKVKQSFLVMKSQPALYKCHLLPEAAVEMSLRCQTDWHHCEGDRLRKQFIDEGLC